jgi:hypothetical protein
MDEIERLCQEYQTFFLGLADRGRRRLASPVRVW